jgi:hypothetical protein
MAGVADIHDLSLLETSFKSGEQIRPRLWLGWMGVALDEDWLRSRGITARVNMALSLVPEFEAKPLQGIRTYSFPLWDGPSEGNTPDIYRDAILTILQLLAAGETVLVNCRFGISRSASTVAGVLSLREDISLEEALDSIRRCRPVCYPHFSHREIIKTRVLPALREARSRKRLPGVR